MIRFLALGAALMLGGCEARVDGADLRDVCHAWSSVLTAQASTNETVKETIEITHRQRPDLDTTEEETAHQEAMADTEQATTSARKVCGAYFQ